MPREAKFHVSAPGKRTIVLELRVHLLQMNLALIAATKQGMRHPARNAARGKVHWNALVVPQQFTVVHFKVIDGEIKKLFGCGARIGGPLASGSIRGPIRGKLHPYHRMLQNQVTQGNLTAQQGKQFHFCDHGFGVAKWDRASRLSAVNREIPRLNPQTEWDHVKGAELHPSARGILKRNHHVITQPAPKAIRRRVPGQCQTQNGKCAQDNEQNSSPATAFLRRGGRHCFSPVSSSRRLI